MIRKIALTTMLLVATVVAGSGLVSAQETTPVDYYNETTPETETDSWLAGLTDASLDSVISLAMRVGTFIIGDGTAAGGVGSAGALLTGLLVAGVMGGIGIRSGAGATGGTVIGLGAGTVFLVVGIGAQWIYPVLLFVVGLLVAAAFLRVLR